jgi:hypothetical protein
MKSDRRLARDVARELERRARRRRLAFLVLLAGLVAFAVMYVRCGGGWGLGGDGKGEGPGGGSNGSSVKLQSGKRCEIFIAKEGITVDGKSMTRAEAVEACAKKGGADIDVAGDARHGDVEALKAALEQKKLQVFVRRGSR